jgi:UDP-N-acetylglucosamine--N-acetylmuramyl-(pentapeptide) pyrophosphoryl-undecaprenol N-acetylglucosamine transferase
MQSKPLKIVISGGGTGGHIFPAIAIADSLKKLRPGADILFIGAEGRMEMERVPLAGYPIESLRISGLQRKFSWKNLSFPFKLIRALSKAKKILRRFSPDVVVGVGGYASGPTLRAAITFKIPTLIQEQNSFPGITNRLLGRRVNKVCVAYENMHHWFPTGKTILTGNPLRKSAIDIEGKQEAALTFFGLSPDIPVLLIIGGSQGAKAINLAIEAGLEKFRDQSLQIIWQTGSLFINQAKISVNNLSLEKYIKPFDFINRMDLAYAAADVIVSRAGAMAISEIAVVAKPAIFVPLPTAAEDHQTKNAKRLVARDAALLIQNKEAHEVLIPTIQSLIRNESLKSQMSENIKAFAVIDASDRIAAEVLKLVTEK